jgi:hypothetical protein
LSSPSRMMVAPQTAQTPRVNGLPFAAMTVCGLAISRETRHLGQCACTEPV